MIKYLRSASCYLRSMFTDIYAFSSYSHEGEDMVLRRIFNVESRTKGFYIDVGAHHPKRFSNTYYFYKNGWRGINIDAMPGSMNSFKKHRPLDINLEFPISSTGAELIYYKFNEPALNGFSKELTDTRQKRSDMYYVEDEVKLMTYTLSDILNSYMPKEVEIDFMSVDVEGFDLEVIQSNDWSKYKPKVILIEILDNSFSNLRTNDIYLFLESIGYVFCAKTVSTVFFRRNDVTI